MTPERTSLRLSLCSLAIILCPGAVGGKEQMLEGRIVDAVSGKNLPARLYIEREDGKAYFARSALEEGSAVVYQKQRGRSRELHTTLSAHPFVAELPAGSYTLVAERGKEYHPAQQKVVVSAQEAPPKVTLRLRRWIDMARRGWYSGDTHVHRSVQELPNLLLAEDLNVAFPLTYWVTRAYEAPARGKGRGDPGAKLVEVDRTHVIQPRNTEYEIFTVGQKRHTLGAVFLLNHKSVFSKGVPPVSPIAEETHDEGGLIELDKHAWPWSMALVPVMKVDLYELANNHHWRTEFLFRGWGAQAAPYMGVERDERGWTEWGWTEYGFQNYYALLDCGFPLRPTAGTASGVHPVPLGFGRVYVHLEGGFSYEAWLRGLEQGRSFVTTGPMLLVKVNDKHPGHRFRQTGDEPAVFSITGTAVSEKPLTRLEVVVNGEIRTTGPLGNRKTPDGAYLNPLAVELEIDGSAWIAARAIEKREGGRIRFAHTAPVHIEVAGKPLRPRRQEVDFLTERVREEIRRSQDVLSKSALDEYRRALRAYEEMARSAR